jgi:glutathione peroxidase
VAGFHDFQVRAIDGSRRELRNYRGRVCLVVNVASKCGLTPQYDGLQRLYDRFQDRGLEVLAFPCNQFAGQEPGSEAEIQTFCTTSYGTTFPLFAKLEVNGPGRDPLYAWLTKQPTGPDGPGDVKWNFAKFVVDRQGRAVARFEPRVEPEAPELVAAIQAALS